MVPRNRTRSCDDPAPAGLSSPHRSEDDATVTKGTPFEGQSLGRTAHVARPAEADDAAGRKDAGGRETNLADLAFTTTKAPSGRGGRIRISSAGRRHIDG